MAQAVKRLPAMRETRVRSLGQEDPLEKDMATHSSIFAWKIPWMEEPGGLQSMGVAESDTTEQLHFHFSSVIQSCPTLCDPMNCSMSGLPVHHQLPEITETRFH